MRLAAVSGFVLLVAVVLAAGGFGECDRSDCGGVVYEVWFDLAQVLAVPLAALGVVGLLFAAGRGMIRSARRN